MEKLNILFAVRDAGAAKLLGRRWEAEGLCAVRVAREGTQAVRMALETAPDVLVIDAVLPGLDGLGVIDRLQARLGSRMPHVVGGSMMGFADEGFLRRGADCVVNVPWEHGALREAVESLMLRIRTRVDWVRAEADYRRACMLLKGLGMHEHLHGFTYLAWAAALASSSEERLYAITERIYAPIASRFGTTPQSVERLIRHAVEGTMDAVGARGIYGFFGNTIDPTRGKPTNGQMIGMLAQRLKVS